MSRQQERNPSGRSWMLDAMGVFLVAAFAYSVAMLIAHAALR